MSVQRRLARAILGALAFVALLLIWLDPFDRFGPGRETRVTVWITGYSYWDNTPPGSAVIAHPVVHDEAGGTGTWDDPVTLAVGRSWGRWHYRPGTRIYVAELRRYAVVEDLCAGCGRDHEGHPHLDVYIGGTNLSAEAAAHCARSITAVQEIVIDPASDYPVSPGEIAADCSTPGQ